MRTTPARATLLLVGVAIVAAALGLAPPLVRAETPPVSHFGGKRFRADRPVTDARFSADGRYVVACAGGIVQVWNAADGALIRKIDTKLDALEDPTISSDKRLAFAVHPKES